MVHWLLRHVCTLHNALKVGDDGYTPWLRARGRPFNQQLCCFGEQIGYKFPGKGPQSNPRGNMGPMWGSGTWLGVNIMSGEHIVATPEGVVHARGFTRRAVDEQWSAEAVAELKATPHSLREPRQRGAAFEHPVEKHQPLEDKLPGLPRSFKITKRDIQAHGYTDDCPQCDHIRSYGEARPGTTHTATCRARIMHEVGQTAQGQARLAAAQERTDRALADHVERHDRGRQDSAPAQEQHPEPDGARSPRAALREMERIFEGPPPDNMDDGDPDNNQQAPASHDDQPMPADVGMDVDTVELLPGHVGRKTARSLGLDFRQPILNVKRNVTSSPALQAHVSSSHPSTGLRSSEGWLPRADDGSRAETSCAAARGTFGTTVNQPEMSQAQTSGLDESMMIFMVQQFGGQPAYHRERRSAARRMVAEVFSPPRITAMLQRHPSLKLTPGFALDLTMNYPDDGMPWDFNLKV